MSRNRRLGLFLFSLLLWIQLVFATGMMVWRFWSVGTGNSEIFVGVGPTIRTNDLINSVNEHCSSGLRIVYVGDRDPDFLFIRYQLYPRSVARLSVNWTADAIEYEIMTKVEMAIGEEKPICLMADGISQKMPIGSVRYEVNEQQSVILLSGSQ